MKKRIRYQSQDNIFASVEQAKLEICRALRKAVDERGLSQLQAALIVGTSQANISRAIRYPTAKKLSFNQLFRYLTVIRPRYRIMISW